MTITKKEYYFAKALQAFLLRMPGWDIIVEKDELWKTYVKDARMIANIMDAMDNTDTKREITG